jgi:DNA-directed RNA polymerase III subunit RPC6
MSGVDIKDVEEALRGSVHGLTAQKLQKATGSSLEALTPALQQLLASSTVSVYTTVPGDTLVYRFNKDGASLEGLTPEQRLVYQICERAGNVGIWTRDIKTQANIPQHTLTKTLKVLEQRSLVKNVKSVVNKSRKLYMLYNATPAKEITGGPWYTDQEFDHAFVEDLCKMVLGMVKQQGVSDSKTILDRLIASSVIEANCLALEDLEMIMQMLVYDGRLEVERGPSGGSHPRYRPGLEVPSYNHLTETPCGVCPVVSQCSPGGLISPESCPYIKDWLALDW